MKKIIFILLTFMALLQVNAQNLDQVKSNMEKKYGELGITMNVN